MPKQSQRFPGPFQPTPLARSCALTGAVSKLPAAQSPSAGWGSPRPSGASQLISRGRRSPARRTEPREAAPWQGHSCHPKRQGAGSVARGWVRWPGQASVQQRLDRSQRAKPDQLGSLPGQPSAVPTPPQGCPGQSVPTPQRGSPGGHCCSQLGRRRAHAAGGSGAGGSPSGAEGCSSGSAAGEEAGRRVACKSPSALGTALPTAALHTRRALQTVHTSRG